MRVIPWSDVQRAYATLTLESRRVEPRQSVNRDKSVPFLHGGLARRPVIGRLLRGVARRVPFEVRIPLGQAVRAQVTVFRSLAASIRAIPSAWAASRQRISTDGADFPPSSGRLGKDLREVAVPGDFLVALGAPWAYVDYPGRVAPLKAEIGLRFGVLIHDIIPLVRPEFFRGGENLLFSSFMRDCVSMADKLLTVSRATANDVEQYLVREKIIMPERPGVLTIGTGFAPADGTSGLPKNLAAGGYVLLVSMIEPRKNHILAFLAWRRLLEVLPRDRVPQLVFLGRVGWMVSDLMQQIQNSDYLGGKLTIIENADDPTLAALYRGARFTLFPSFYEGWGLPVSESLAFGKVCLASNSTSIPEAGGAFCLYHDPESVTEAFELYKRAIEEPELITNMETRIREEYQPVSWSVSARDLLNALLPPEGANEPA